MEKNLKVLILAALFLTVSSACWAESPVVAKEELTVIEVAPPERPQEPQDKLSLVESLPNSKYMDPLKYTLGPDDVIQIDVMRHPEFSGTFPVNLEGKIQIKFVGDIDVNGLTKAGLEEKLRKIVSTYVMNPEVNVAIMEYKSKVIYVIGEVGRPGKYYMRSDSISVREAVVEAGFPTVSAAMRRCRLITPDRSGRARTQAVDVYSILYGGNLNKDLEMHAGDVLYVPATMMAKVIRVINPVASTIGLASSPASDASSAATAAKTLVK